jgi:sugar lactone lactonase YvrE
MALCLFTACGGDGGTGDVPLAAPCGSGACVSTVAGSGAFGTADGSAAAAEFFMPHALALDADARLHVADFGSSNGTRLVADGQVSSIGNDAIDFPHPADRATDAAGNTYVADPYGNRILRITPAGVSSVLAGTGRPGDADGDAAAATFSMPSGLVLDASGALLVADMGNRKIRRITLPRG